MHTPLWWGFVPDVVIWPPEELSSKHVSPGPARQKFHLSKTRVCFFFKYTEDVTTTLSYFGCSFRNPTLVWVTVSLEIHCVLDEMCSSPPLTQLFWGVSPGGGEM